MPQVTARNRRTKRPEADRLWQRVLSCFVALCFVLVALQPAAAELYTSDTPISFLKAANADHGPSDPSDQGLDQHCAHCGCHQPVQLSAFVAVTAPPATTIRFALAEVDRRTRTTPPPSEPPRT